MILTHLLKRRNNTMWDNDYDKWQQELGRLSNVQTQTLEKNLNQILEPENKGKAIFYPYKTGQTHNGLKRDVSIVLDLLELYRDNVDPENWESATHLEEPTHEDLREYRDEFFHIDRYFEALDNLENKIEFFKDIQRIAEEDYTHRRKQRLIHLTAHSAGIMVSRSPMKKEELPDGEEIVTEWYYQVNIFKFNILDRISRIQEFFEEKAEEQEKEEVEAE